MFKWNSAHFCFSFFAYNIPSSLVHCLLVLMLGDCSSILCYHPCACTGWNYCGTPFVLWNSVFQTCGSNLWISTTEGMAKSLVQFMPSNVKLHCWAFALFKASCLQPHYIVFGSLLILWLLLIFVLFLLIQSMLK